MTNNIQKPKLDQPAFFSNVEWESDKSLSFHLRSIIFKAFKELYQKDLDIKLDLIILEHPSVENYGDFSSNVALLMASRLKMKPIDLANKLKEKIDEYIRVDQRNTRKSSSNKSSVDRLAVGDILENVETATPGFINLWLQKRYLISQVSEVLEILNPDKTIQNITFREKAPLGESKVMIEFAHPNTHKAFHIGHLRNISTGETLVRLFRWLGAKVIPVNYQGDVGMHIAKCLYGILKNPKSEIRNPKLKSLKEKIEFISKAYSQGTVAYEEDEKAKERIKDINYLIYAAAQKFQEEHGIAPSSTDYLKFVTGLKGKLDKINELWKETRQWSLDAFEEIYKRVFTKFERYYFEGECLNGVDISKDAVKIGVLQKDAGAIIFNGKPFGLDTRVFVNSLGLPTYEAKELALAEKEFSEYGNLDCCMHVVTPEQKSFFQITFKVEELLNPKKFKGKQFHFAYEWVNLKAGKMSSRVGNVILGEWLLDQAKKRILKIIESSDRQNSLEQGPTQRPIDIEEITEKVAVAAVKYSMLKVNPKMPIAFDIEESISLEGDSGPYLLYTYARCRSVLRKAQIANYEPRTLNQELESSKYSVLSSKLNSEELSILRTTYRFEEVVIEAVKNLSPNLLCSYIFDLAQKYNLFYNKHTILGHAKNFEPRTKNKERRTKNLEHRTKNIEQDTSKFRLLLTEVTAAILKQGLYLLGIETVERM